MPWKKTLRGLPFRLDFRFAVHFNREISRGTGLARMSAHSYEVGGFSVMIACLHEIDPFMPNNINEPVFLSNTTGPDTWSKKLQRLRLADTLKRISHYRFDQLKNT
jgi:hypothetical protein